MRVVVQRCESASVEINNRIVGQINQGYVLLVGLEHNDTKEIVDKMINKLIKQRICEDENGKLNLDITQINGEILSISQFTLYADCKKGNRPSFTNSMEPTKARELYEYFNNQLSQHISNVQTGVFGEYMKVSLVNDGPVTIILDSDHL